MAAKARFVGFNHVAVEVDDIEEALDFFGKLFEVRLRGRGEGMAFIDAGDQFLALSEGRQQEADGHRHIGLVVDDRRKLREALEAVAGETGAEILPGGSLDFLDPWGNHWQVVEYGDVQFSKTPEILSGMGLDRLEKSEKALDQLRSKGLAAG